MSLVSRAIGVAGMAAIVALPVGLLATQSAAPPPVTHLVAPPMTVRELQPDPSALRVCSDPNNLPFSNARGEGFENAIADLVARDLSKRVTYYWLPQRRGFVRNSLRLGLCDVIIGVPAGYDLVKTTQPYYRSTYVFVSRRDHRLQLGSFDAPVLRRLSIGIQITGDDYENPPAAQALAARRLAANVRGYTVYGDYSRPDPQRAIVDDVSAGRVDTAVVWGPIAGFFAAREPVALRLVPVTPSRDAAAGPFVFDIAMGVRKDDAALQQALDRVLERRRGDIQQILRRYGVPLAEPGRGEPVGAGS